MLMLYSGAIPVTQRGRHAKDSHLIIIRGIRPNTVPVRVSRRAKIFPLAAEGKTQDQIASEAKPTRYEMYSQLREY